MDLADVTPEKICFVIAPIGEPGSDTRRRSDQVYKHIIKPAVESRGYRAVRADQESQPGMITTQIIQHVMDDPVVIADLTERNPNVFYELAIRQSFRKPFIQIIDSRETIPFDVAALRTIQFAFPDLDEAARCRDEIAAQISAIESGSSPIVTPISMAADIRSFMMSGDPEKQLNADMMLILTDIQRRILHNSTNEEFYYFAHSAYQVTSGAYSEIVRAFEELQSVPGSMLLLTTGEQPLYKSTQIIRGVMHSLRQFMEDSRAVLSSLRSREPWSRATDTSIAIPPPPPSVSATKRAREARDRAKEQQANGGSAAASDA